MTKRTIYDWVAATTDENGWAYCYKELLGLPISDKKKFMKAVDDFGSSIMLQSIMAASTRKLTGDPLNYVMGIAIAKANEIIADASDEAKYQMQLDKSKHRVAQQNEELEAKLERARKANGIE